MSKLLVLVCVCLSICTLHAAVFAIMCELLGMRMCVGALECECMCVATVCVCVRVNWAYL